MAQKSQLSVAPPPAPASHSQTCDTFHRLQPALLRHILKLICMKNGGSHMTEATIGARYQVVIPKNERRRLKLKPGLKVDVHAEKDRIVIYPVANQNWRGIGKDIADGVDASDYIKRLREEWGERA